jgi:hypothetical protein
MRKILFTATSLLLLTVLLSGCEGDTRPTSALPETGDDAIVEAAPTPPVSGSATLSWQPPAERLDGSPLLNLAGYRILYGQESGRYSHIVEIDSAGITRYFIDDLGEGTWYFAIVAIDTEGLESPPSAEVSKTV